MPELRHELPEGRGLHQGLVRPARDQASRQQSLDSAVLGEKILPPEAGDGYTADYDIELWGWSGAIDPNGLLQIFECSAIGSSSDSQYCNPAYDQMYEDQLKAPTAEARKAILAQMQNLIYDKAVYDILYYDANLEAYRTDRFAGWQNQPIDSGEPFFTYSTLQYTKLTNAKAAPTPAPSQAAGLREPGGIWRAIGGGGHPGAQRVRERRLGRLDHADPHRRRGRGHRDHRGHLPGEPSEDERAAKPDDDDDE